MELFPANRMIAWFSIFLLMTGLSLGVACGGGGDDDDDTAPNDDDTIDDDDTGTDDDDDPFQYEPGTGTGDLPASRIDLMLGNLDGGMDPVWFQAVDWIEIGGVQVPVLRFFDGRDGTPLGLDLFANLDEEGFLFGGVETAPGLGNIDGGIGLMLDEPVEIPYGSPVGETQSVEVDGELTIGEPGVDPSVYLPIGVDYTVEDEDATAPAPEGPVEGCVETSFEAGTSGIVLKRLAQGIENALGGGGTVWSHPESGFVHGEINLPPFGQLSAGVNGCRANFTNRVSYARLTGLGVLRPCETAYRLSTFDVFKRADVDRNVRAGVRIEARWTDAARARTLDQPPLSVEVNGQAVSLGSETTGLFYASEWGTGILFWRKTVEIPIDPSASPGEIEIKAELDPSAGGNVRFGAVVEYFLSDPPPDLNGLAPELDCPLEKIECGECGNGIVEGNEVCDGELDAPCQMATAAVDGTQDCLDDCSGYTPCVPLPFCGDGQVNGNEVCEPGLTLVCLDEESGREGTQECFDDCSGWGDCVLPGFCGDQVVDDNEVCDSAQSRTCRDEAGYAGHEDCLDDCSGWGRCVIDEYCGDGVVNGPEECDDGNTEDYDECAYCRPNGPCDVMVLTDVALPALTGSYNSLGLKADEGSQQLTLPFAFNYFGNTITQVWVDINGYLTTESGAVGSAANGIIPSPDTFDGIIAPFWDDLTLDATACQTNTCLVYTRTAGTAPNRRFMVRWEQAEFTALNSYHQSRVTFQVTFHETSNIVEFTYGELKRGDVNEWPNLGQFATIGVESPDGQLGFMHSYEQPAVAPGMSIQYQTEGCRCDIETPVDCYGVIGAP